MFSFLSHAYMYICIYTYIYAYTYIYMFLVRLAISCVDIYGLLSSVAMALIFVSCLFCLFVCLFGKKCLGFSFLFLTSLVQTIERERKKACKTCNELLLLLTRFLCFGCCLKRVHFTVLFFFLWYLMLSCFLTCAAVARLKTKKK